MNIFNRISIPAILLAVGLIGSGVTTSNAAVFAKYDGVDGESTDAEHPQWIDVLSLDWGMHRPGGGATGQSRRRGAAIVEDVTLTIEYEKASPKLQELCLEGKVIPKLEIEQTSTYGGARATYIKYELKNVMITGCFVSTEADGRTMLEVSTAFQQMTVTSVITTADGEVAESVLNVKGRLARPRPGQP